MGRDVNEDFNKDFGGSGGRDVTEDGDTDESKPIDNGRYADESKPIKYGGASEGRKGRESGRNYSGIFADYLGAGEARTEAHFLEDVAWLFGFLCDRECALWYF